MPEGTIEPTNDSRAPSPASGEDAAHRDAMQAPAVSTTETQAEGDPPDSVLDVAHSLQVSFDEVLALSRAYQRVRNLESDAVSYASTTRSHSWSILSGISFSQVTRIGVICLPLYEAELVRFHRLASSEEVPAALTRTYSSSILRTLEKHLAELRETHWTSDIAAGPMGDDLVQYSNTPFCDFASDMSTAPLAGNLDGTSKSPCFRICSAD
jgi:hypothetical protein